MQIRRSQVEAQKREEGRKTLAGIVAKSFSRNPFSARILGEVKQEESAPKASPQTEHLTRSAIHFASREFRESGLHNVALGTGEVEVFDAIKGPKLEVIKSASVKLTATMPTVENRQVVRKPFFVNLTFNEGKFSVDSLEKNRQLFAVNKNSLTRLAAMPDSEAAQSPPTNEEHSGDDANMDVQRNADEKEEKTFIVRESDLIPVGQEGNEREGDSELNDMMNSSPETQFVAPKASPTPSPAPSPNDKK